jgi:hypothetical protein
MRPAGPDGRVVRACRSIALLSLLLGCGTPDSNPPAVAPDGAAAADTGGDICERVALREDGFEAYLSLELYCAAERCPANETEYRGMFTSCQERSWSQTCRVRRIAGCDQVRYFSDHEESGFYLVSFDASTGILRGVTSASDTPSLCGAIVMYAGEAGSRPGSAGECQTVDETYCCAR